MLYRKLFLCVACFCVVGVAPAQTVLTSVIHNGHTYSLLSQSNWTTAEAKAISLGGHLTTINDASENAWVFSTFGTYGGVNRDLWIGLNDRAKEGTFVWADGDTSAYRHWSGGQPDNTGGIEDFVHIQSNSFPGFHGYWNDLNDTSVDAYSKLYGVVEVNAVPEPSALAMLGLGMVALNKKKHAA